MYVCLCALWNDGTQYNYDDLYHKKNLRRWSWIYNVMIPVINKKYNI